MKNDIFKESWVIVNGIPLFARVSLEQSSSGATPIVHLHGFAISGSYLLPTAARLATDFPTYVPDLPGYGRSHGPKRTLTITGLADALRDYLDVVGVDKVVLLGNSMGCLIAIEFVRKYRERVDRVVLVSPAGGPHNQPLFRGLPQLALDGMRESPRMFIVAVPDYLKFGVMNAFRLFRAMTRYPTIENFLHLDCPALIVVGYRDPLVSKERMKLALEAHLDLQMVFLQDAAHAVNFSHPGVLARIVKAFIEERPLLDDIRPEDHVELLTRASDA
jgi:pimeloyl-ACP methyl ester carboxylesterase